MGDWRRMGHEQRRRVGAPASTLVAAVNEFQTGMGAQNAAVRAASAHGHTMGTWEPYGAANIKSLCMNCGAEIRVPYSTNQHGFLPHRGQAVDPTAGNCAEQAVRYPNRRRGCF